MKSITRTSLALVAAAAVAVPAFAQNLAKETGNIVSTNWNAMEIEIKDPKGRVGTWKVRRDATVVFTDKKGAFPNPKLSDLRPPMYVHFNFNDDTKVIEYFDVREVGFEPSQGGPGIRQDAEVTNLDANIGHLEVRLGGGMGVKTFEVDPKGQLRNFKIGDKVSILIETREGGREVITKVNRK